MLSQSETERLLQHLCRRLGFCIPPDAAQKLIDTPPSTVTEFTDAVFVAEGLDTAAADRHIYRQVRAMVTAAYDSASGNDSQ